MGHTSNYISKVIKDVQSIFKGGKMRGFKVGGGNLMYFSKFEGEQNEGCKHFFTPTFDDYVGKEPKINFPAYGDKTENIQFCLDIYM